MKKTMIFENEFDYDNWFKANEEKEGGHDFIEDRVVIVKGTRTIQNRKFNGFSADATINCKNVKTAIRRFIKELKSNGFNVSEDEFESNVHCFTDCGYVVEIEEIDEGVFYVNYMCYQNEVEETTETATDTETADQDETTEPEILKPLEIIFDDENSKPEIRTKFYLLEIFNRLNINHYYVELMTGKKKGDFYLYLKFDENSNVEMALCKIFHLNAEYRNNAFEKRFLYALAEKYNGLYCTPDYDDFTFYKKIACVCKTPETFEPFISSGEKCFFISPDKNSKKSAINSLYGITANTSSEISNEHGEVKELLAVKQFEHLTRTLFKSLFKAIGLEETKKIPFIISNNMVFFNYNGVQYKYYPSQCKIFKKSGRKYQRINWKGFADDNSPTDQKQALGRSPPLLLI